MSVRENQKTQHVADSFRARLRSRFFDFSFSLGVRDES